MHPNTGECRWLWGGFRNTKSDVRSLKMSLICVKDIRKVYRVDQERVVALNRINLNIEHGEICCILGTSGSGKSTLLNIMAGLEKPTKGAVLIDGQDIAQMSERQLALFRQLNIGFIFQSYNLMPTMTAMENVALPLMFKGVGRRERMKEAKRMLKRVNLGSRLSHKPTQMSGGQQQRVGIARAFVAKPKIVFADEPTGNLDSKTTIEVMEMIVRMARKYHETLILVTHDQEIAEYADRIVHLVDGNIVSDESNQSLIRADEKAEDGKAAGESVEKNVDLAGETAE
jgi:putative ABC transport system ATP-binding protein